MSSERARPFLKWAGGKGRLLSQLAPLMPEDVDSLRHVEPFAGGAALFFGRAPGEGRLADVNERLIRTYRAVRDDVQGLIAHLAELADRHGPAHFYEVRDRFNRTDLFCDAELGAAFIYLNRTCFNGLYRENRQGAFNVPIGRYAKPTILDEALLLHASSCLQGVDLEACDFERALGSAGVGDFVYLDPPYQPVSEQSSFCAYSRDGFGWPAQQRLRATFGDLDRRGATVMLSNSDTPEIRQLYAGWAMTTVVAPRSISSRGSERGLVRELVVRNYE